MTQPPTSGCICPHPPRAVRGCPAHTARYAAQQDGEDPDPVEPVPLPALHLYSQEIRCCAQPMRYQVSHSSWTGAPGHGNSLITTTRTCTTCGGTAVVSTTTPS